MIDHRKMLSAAVVALALALASTPASASGTLPWASEWGTFTTIQPDKWGVPVTYDAHGRADASGVQIGVRVKVVPPNCALGSDVTFITGGLAAASETGLNICRTVMNADGGYSTSGVLTGESFVRLRISPPGWSRRPVTLPAFLDIAAKKLGEATPTRLRVMEFGIRWTFGTERSFLTNGKRVRAARYQVVNQHLVTP